MRNMSHSQKTTSEVSITVFLQFLVQRYSTAAGLHNICNCWIYTPNTFNFLLGLQSNERIQKISIKASVLSTICLVMPEFHQFVEALGSNKSSFLFASSSFRQASCWGTGRLVSWICPVREGIQFDITEVFRRQNSWRHKLGYTFELQNRSQYQNSHF